MTPQQLSTLGAAVTLTSLVACVLGVLVGRALARQSAFVGGVLGGALGFGVPQLVGGTVAVMNGQLIPGGAMILFLGGIPLVIGGGIAAMELPDRVPNVPPPVPEAVVLALRVINVALISAAVIVPVEFLEFQSSLEQTGVVFAGCGAAVVCITGVEFFLGSRSFGALGAMGLLGLASLVGGLAMRAVAVGTFTP